MNGTGHRVDGRAVVLFVLLDLLTYALLYWLVMPAFAEVLLALDPTTSVAIGWVLSAVRLVLVGVVVARSYRRRHGFEARSELLPTAVVAGVTAWSAQLLLGVLASVIVGVAPGSWAMLRDLAVWVGFAVVATLFVQPGPAETMPLRFRQALGSDRGAVNVMLVPAVVAVVVGALLLIGMVGSAANDEREARTAADAAALAAVDRWRLDLRSAFDAATGSSDAADFWAFAGTDLGSLASGGMTSAADRYAQANDAELVSFDVDPANARVTVRVRHLDTVPETTTRKESVATAELVLRSGVCRSGSRLGFLVGGTCRTSAPPPPPVPSPTPEPTPSPGEPTPSPTPPPPPPPFAPPSGIGVFRVDTRLATS
ncbi:hypothetical protein [Cellulomonas dongxiuzhuiae]|uniref:Flp pilus-assembly TadG-like N-terminal domain-containing protein n=1 Tax=Cellulomonas dongxiuzhuiae TaxID=2819979 RepID=A0ABX8GGC4_9CELL|nr:hypothetical protein [Cellulomonas dongxiuzhuiae]MBO3088552.1 hypothetical protein [Cellulomonas dongxiuzhuiae]MBO3094115.1 hypothetical protein [Cellulomonas dongxiuzhuiae]QWC15179.1 hypothetical protein KKR89_12700 [Cellulomonas dongxiuzhuiae]